MDDAELDDLRAVASMALQHRRDVQQSEQTGWTDNDRKNLAEALEKHA